jgi:hypothetical protein
MGGNVRGKMGGQDFAAAASVPAATTTGKGTSKDEVNIY